MSFDERLLTCLYSVQLLCQKYGKLLIPDDLEQGCMHCLLVYLRDLEAIPFNRMAERNVL